MVVTILSQRAPASEHPRRKPNRVRIIRRAVQDVLNANRLWRAAPIQDRLDRRAFAQQRLDELVTVVMEPRSPKPDPAKVGLAFAEIKRGKRFLDDLTTISADLLPVVVIRELMMIHRVAVNPKSRQWLAFSDRYGMLVMSL